jgi:hypothetical protein
MINFSFQQYKKCISIELKFVKSMVSQRDLYLIGSNIAAYEIVLLLLKNPIEGIPVYKAISQSGSNNSSQSGTLKKIKLLRDAGLIDAVSGRKGSEVCLVPSEKLMRTFFPLLIDKYKLYNNI